MYEGAVEYSDKAFDEATRVRRQIDVLEQAGASAEAASVATYTTKYKHRHVNIWKQAVPVIKTDLSHIFIFYSRQQ